MKTILDQATCVAETIYKKLHSDPELGNQEIRTTKLIEETLAPLGFKIRKPLPTGLIADIKGDSEDIVAFRADIDALPIQEETGLPFASKNTGVMHACGHDVHTAVLIGFAHVLSQRRPDSGIRLIFQPDEEGDGGADRLIKAGAMKGVKKLFGLHVMPELPSGNIGIKSGIVHGASKMFRVKINGVQAHGAKPHLGCDAVYCGSVFVSMCQGIITRSLDPLHPGLITFGTIEGGDGRNVLADCVELEGIIRGVSCDFISSRMEAVARGLEIALGAEIQLSFQPGYKLLKNDDGILAQVREAAGQKAVELKNMTMTVDDFASYLYEVPGAFFFLGCGFPGKENSGLHTGSFQADITCIRTGIALLTKLCQ